MKTGYWIASITISISILPAGLALADVGMLDGADAFKDFASTKSRAEVRAEMDNTSPQHRSAINGMNGVGNDIGARGTGGSRYSTRTREEVIDELIQHRKMHRSFPSSDIYFGE